MGGPPTAIKLSECPAYGPTGQGVGRGEMKITSMTINYMNSLFTNVPMLLYFGIIYSTILLLSH